ncbi:MAG: DEAD/DEAH box helicase [Muribaculaceae bacterium]|nr:DEAD/DEAH box helicase [Muribaculaceae bacterium]
MREKEFLPNIKKLGIEEINDMQKRSMAAASETKEIILVAPTGSGKTVAFTLPMLKWLNPPTGRVQSIIIAPSRELVIQIAGVVRELASGFKVTALYGGHNVDDEVNTLSVTPDIIVATPGRLLDHLKRGNVDPAPTRILILDEYDKSLELGFEDDMRKIFNRLKNVSRIILTSATASTTLPAFIKLDNPLEIDFSENAGTVRERMKIYRVDTEKDKLESLLGLLKSISKKDIPERTIIFVNHRESAVRVSEFLKKHKVACALYHGELDQFQREDAISMFNNGSTPILIATDLAARGLDIRGVSNIIHYHQPLTPETYTHRNGRTARVDASGDIYVLTGPDEELKPFIETDGTYRPDPNSTSALKSDKATIRISAGRKEKLSKGDIVGFLCKEGGLEASEVGPINLSDHHALVAVPADKAKRLIKELESKKIKGNRRKLTLL